MTQPVETTLNEWNDVKKLEAGNPGLHTKLFFGFLGYLVIPVIIAVLFNKFGLKHWNWMLMGFLTIIDIYVMTKPWPWAAVSILGYIRGQVGGEKGLDVSDGVDKGWDWLKGVYSFVVSTILGKQIAFVALAILPINRNEGAVAVILGVILVVILGASLSKSGWVIRAFYVLYCFLLAGASLYWIAAYNWPDLRPSQAKTVAEEADLEIRDQRDEWLAQEVTRIRKEMSKMKSSLTPEQRLAKLSPEDREIWEEAKRGIGGRAASSITEGASAVHKDTLEKWGSKDGSPAKTEERVPTTPSIPLVSKWEGVYTPSETNQPVHIGNFKAGKYCLKGNRFGEYRMQLAHVKGQGSLYKMNYRGEYVDHGFTTNPYVPTPEEGRIPFPGFPYAYGAVIVLVNDQAVYAADGRKFTIPEGARLALDVNISTNMVDRKGSHGHQLTVEEC